MTTFFPAASTRATRGGGYRPPSPKAEWLGVLYMFQRPAISYRKCANASGQQVDTPECPVALVCTTTDRHHF
jgi:hypothetical protein